MIRRRVAGGWLLGREAPEFFDVVLVDVQDPVGLVCQAGNFREELRPRQSLFHLLQSLPGRLCAKHLFPEVSRDRRLAARTEPCPSPSTHDRK